MVDGRKRRKRFVGVDEVDVGDAVRQVTQISEKISRIFREGIADTLYSWGGSRQHRAALINLL